MAIDMAALAKASKGNPNDRVQVNRRWLAEVERQLMAGADAQARLDAGKRNDSIIDSLFGQAFGRRPRA